MAFSGRRDFTRRSCSRAIAWISGKSSRSAILSALQKRKRLTATQHSLNMWRGVPK